MPPARQPLPHRRWRCRRNTKSYAPCRHRRSIRLLVFRSVHPLYGAFLIDQLGIADRNERIQAMESVLEMPRPLLRYVRVPRPDQLPPGPLAINRLDPD